MGIFTDVYNVSAAFGKPLAGVLRYGAKQVDSFVNELIGEDTQSTNTRSAEGTTAPNEGTQGVVVVTCMEDLTGEEIAKMYKLVRKGFSPEDTASIVSTKSRQITVAAVIDASQKLG